MQDPRTSRTTPPPPAGRPGPRSESSDADLVAALRTRESDQEDHATALLLARHWQALLDYAEMRSPSTDAASMLATAAFGKVLDTLRGAGPVPALRPEFLTTARHTANVWAAEGQKADTVWEHPGRPAGAGPGSPDVPAPPENRRLAFHAFQAMPTPSRYLLWHTAVEAEPITVPAGLLGIDPESALTELEHSGELFRSGCVRAHIQLAPDKECRHYNRLLDVSLRRGGALLPDIQQHLAVCSYCAYAAEQFVQAEGRPGVLLAEALLGPHGRRYLDSRPGRRGGARAAGVRGRARHSLGGRPRVLPRVTVLGKRVLTTPGRPRTVLLSGLGLVTVGLLAVTVSSLTAGESGGEAVGPSAPIGSGTATTSPDPGSQGVSGPGQKPPTGADGVPSGPLRTTLRSADADLCLDLRDTRPTAGSEATLAICSTSARTQLWLYEEDGLLRNGADQDLCLNSRTVDGSLILGPCTDPPAENATDVRYDLTVQGHVIPRWDDSLAVVPTTPVAGTSVVTKTRDESTLQNWSTTAAPNSPRSLPIVGGSGRGAAPSADTKSALRNTGRSAEPKESTERGGANGGGGGRGPGLETPGRGEGRQDTEGDRHGRGDNDVRTGNGKGNPGQERRDDVRFDG
ncbi:ricin-type beta-trefoil lectin domain protein [Streptomyces sp. NPDC051217]|uniref:ricin-type beta-trefoil lectin domain protein n=1 Tax=Streptomyces sp. NPDC051217 TaxID=3365644 RepID=UPI0037B93FEE